MPGAGGLPGREMWRTLYARIEAVYRENHGVYGSPRISAELNDQGTACSENRMARLMPMHGLQAKHSRRSKTTISA